jgi:DNA-binding HxlR family transcriptional regulator
MANTKKPISTKSLEALKELKEGTFTMSELVERGVDELNSAHLTALVNRGLAEAVKIERDVVTTVKRKVNAYTLTEKGRSYKAE